VVAVVDTGTRAEHPDLAPNLWVNPDEVDGNGIDDDGDGYVDDVHGVNLTPEGPPHDIADRNGHGTLVAGVLAAAADGRGIVGVAHRARLMTVKVLDAAATGTTTAVAEAERAGGRATTAADGGRTLASFSNWGPAAVPSPPPAIAS
jgi:subtilisin family serine protease